MARRNALTVLQRRKTLENKLPLLLGAQDAEAPEPDSIPDGRLRLIFVCCHPALSREAQVALTLRRVCGVATSEIAHAFVVAEATMAARLTAPRRSSPRRASLTQCPLSASCRARRGDADRDPPSLRAGRPWP